MIEVLWFTILLMMYSMYKTSAPHLSPHTPKDLSATSFLASLIQVKSCCPWPFVLAVYFYVPHMKKVHVYSVSSFWLTSFTLISSSSTDVTANYMILFVLELHSIPLYTYIRAQLLNPFICSWAFGWFPYLGFCN